MNRRPAGWLEAVAGLTLVGALLWTNPYSSEGFEGNRFLFLWLMALLALLPTIQDPRRTLTLLQRDPLAWSALLVVSVAALSSALSILPSRSLWGVPPRLHGAVSITALAVLVLALRPLAKHPERQRRLAVGLVFGLCAAALYAFFQRLGLDPVVLARGWPDRVTGTQGNPIFFGALLALGLPWSALLLAQATTTRRRLALGLLLALQGLALFWTASRGPQLAALLGLAAGLVAVYRGPRLRRLLGFGLVAGVLLATLLAITEPGRSWRTVSERQLIWNTALETYAEAPAKRKVFGFGPETFLWVVSPRLPAELPAQAARPDATYDRAHQTGWQLAIEQGAFGVLAWLALLAAALHRLLPASRPRAWLPILATGALAGGGLALWQAPALVGLGGGLGLLAGLAIVLTRHPRLAPFQAALLGTLVAAFVHGLFAPRTAGTETLLFLLLAVFVPLGRRGDAADRESAPPPAEAAPARLPFPWIALGFTALAFGLWTPPQEGADGWPHLGLLIALVATLLPAALLTVSWRRWIPWSAAAVLAAIACFGAALEAPPRTFHGLLLATLVLACWAWARHLAPPATATRGRVEDAPPHRLWNGATVALALLAGAWLVVPKFDAFAQMRRGDAAFEQRRMAAAADFYRMAVERFPDCDSCRLASFRARIRQGEERDLDGEIAAAEKSNRFDARFPRERAYLAARRSSRARDPQTRARQVSRAGEHFARAATLAPTDARLRRLWANLELEQGQPRQALALLDAAVALSPSSADGHLLRARALLDLEQATAAESALRRALELDHERVRDTLGAMASAQPPRWQALRDWALLAAALGRREEAREVLSRARRLAPPAAAAGLGEIERSLLGSAPGPTSP
ncbi:MAG: O-antigen ligase family protein [Acidobacteriota bacterium]